uniref:RNA 3'-terminal phosphate cyclase like-protein, putative n=1 Tax=Theileria annulata TaxID=5874 RepID=A0A3B0MQZ9_THEAN
MTSNNLISDSDESSDELKDSTEDLEDISRDYLRLSVVFSFLTNKPLHIQLVEPIRSYEVSLLKLVTKVTDGTRTEVDRNTIKLTPGRFIGGDFTFQCDNSIPLTYYLEPLVLLFPFSSNTTTITLSHGINNTNSNSTETNNSNRSPAHVVDMNEYYSSLECFSSVCTIILQMIGSEVVFRYKEPYEVYFSCGPVKKVEPIILWKSPKIKRIRGTVVARNLQPSLGKNAIIAAKRVLDQVCDNTWIALNTPPGKYKPTLIISLIAEGTKNCIFTSNTLSNPLDINSTTGSSKNTSTVTSNNASNMNMNSDNSGGGNVEKKVGMGRSLLKILNLAKNTNNSDGFKNTKSDNKTLDMDPESVDQNPQPNSETLKQNPEVVQMVEVEEMDVDGKHYGIIGECERVGEKCAYRLCSEIALDSVIDTTHQHLLLYFMALSGDHQVSQIRLAKLNRYSVHLLRLIKIHLGIIFKFQEIQTESGHNVLLVKCVGSNYQNINLKSF